MNVVRCCAVVLRKDRGLDGGMGREVRTDDSGLLIEAQNLPARLEDNIEYNHQSSLTSPSLRDILWRWRYRLRLSITITHTVTSNNIPSNPKATLILISLHCGLGLQGFRSQHLVQE